MTDAVIVTVHYTPPGTPDSLLLELHAEPGARLTLHLSSPPLPAADTCGTAEKPKAVAPIPEPRHTSQDWDLPGLPAECSPGRAPHLLTDAQATARIRYGYQQGWTQRRIATFAGRATGTVHKHISRFKQENRQPDQT
ncbi:helix-turn-helix domain-containing protein [Streptomyces violaceusniger]|uniref:helix-turn-helix domain-containing protein n=1 Tax=Streptomyces violaceusniger TaxID=68280 RepID=UPI00341360D7